MENWVIYRISRDAVKIVLRKSKCAYIKDQLDSSLSPRKQWEGISIMIYPSLTPNKIEKISVNNTLISNSTQIANEFNNFFTQVPHDVPKDLPFSFNPIHYLENHITTLASLTYVPLHHQKSVKSY